MKREKTRKWTPDPLTRIFAANLRHHRKRLGLSLSELSILTQDPARDHPRRTPVSISYLSLLENEHRSPSLEIVERLAQALGVRVGTLLEERKES